jgi:YbbR domain-containing protein
MKEFFFKNFGLKIASIILAIILWFVASSRGQSEIFIDVQLEFMNIPSGVELINSTDKTISLNIKGPEKYIKNIKPSDIRAFIDLSKAKKGESTYYLAKENIQLPRSITLLNINPSSITVTTEETVTKTVRVIPVITGVPERGYKLQTSAVVPKDIQIEGIQSEVIKIRTIKTESVDITGVNETFAQKLKLDLRGKNIRTKPDSVTVTVIISGGEKQ